MKKICFFIIVFNVIFSCSAYSWEGKTHRGITTQVEEKNEILKKYMKNIGYAEKMEKTPFRIYEGEYYTPPKFLDRTETRESMPPWNLCVGSLNRSALDWLVGAAAEEDCPEIRAANHFHDPTNGLGWRERSEVTAIG